MPLVVITIGREHVTTPSISRHYRPFAISRHFTNIIAYHMKQIYHARLVYSLCRTRQTCLARFNIPTRSDMLRAELRDYASVARVHGD